MTVSKTFSIIFPNSEKGGAPADAAKDGDAN